MQCTGALLVVLTFACTGSLSESHSAHLRVQKAPAFAGPGARGRAGPLLRLRGGKEGDAHLMNDGDPAASMEYPGIQMFRYQQQEGLEPTPNYALRTADQEEGVDYSAFGFMFDVRARDAPLVVTGLQICSGLGTPYDYKVQTCRGSWTEARHDHSKWTICGGGNRIYVPDYEHNEYGSVPFASEGVEMAPGETRGFLIHSNNAISAVGYRALDDTDNLDKRITDQDAHMELLEGAMINTKKPFQRREDRTPSPPRAEGEDEQWWNDEPVAATRAFLGVVEYELK
ncbi:hypothetical protein T484DRAFT_1977832 [Baffinella frigidus]|nr:hypothetical protein T484DRAFT_1977832 [Cryptophyta sp. CCMP2293]